MSRCVKGKLLADQQESRAFVNNSRDLSGMQKSQLNLLTILFQPEAFSRPYACCSAASRIEANTFYIGTFIERYKLYNGEWCTLLQQANAYKIIVYLVTVLINLGANH